MTKDDLKDPRVRAFVINATVNGLKTEIKTIEERNEFAINLVEFLTQDFKNGIFAHGDEDGILIENGAGTMIGVISVLEGIIKFQQLLQIDEMSEELRDVLGRAVLSTISLTAAWHGDNAHTVQPVGGLGLIHGGEEHGVEWDNIDGYGIT